MRMRNGQWNVLGWVILAGIFAIILFAFALKAFGHLR